MNSDVNIKYVMGLRSKVDAQIKLQMAAADTNNQNNAANMRRVIIQCVVDELTRMLGSDNKPYDFKRG